ncbi:MAG: hypothetical protein U9Q35_12215 [Pseudomonadota bacterium]|nr:hypothetical protein [Pseudomonadota bacterium]
MLFNDNGQIQAVIVSGSEAYGYGTYAYPFYGYNYGWSPAYDAYKLPYTADEVSGMESFNVDKYINNG